MSKTIEVESCIDCRFSSTDGYNTKICNLGIGELGLFYPKEPPADCPLREGAVTVKLKGSEPDYKEEVLKVYPDAVIRQSPFTKLLILMSDHKWLVYKPIRGEINLWKSAYEHIKKQLKMIYTQKQKVSPESFEDYLKIPHHSFSSLKQQDVGYAFSYSEKMRIGKLVDCILTKQMFPTNETKQNIQIARAIANDIFFAFGSFIPQLQSQVAFTAVIEEEPFKLPVKGILDFLLPKRCVIDLKITFEKITTPQKAMQLAKYMRYDCQLFNYKNLSDAKAAYIMMHSVPTGKTFLFEINDFAAAENWWIDKILQYAEI